MNRLKKELMNRGIIYEYDAYDAPYEAEEVLVSITTNFIITAFFCSVIEPQYKLYDRNFNFLGQQSSQKEDDFFGEKVTNPWMTSIAQ